MRLSRAFQLGDRLVARTTGFLDRDSRGVPGWAWMLLAFGAYSLADCALYVLK
jgi:hypothetical protein